MLSSIVLSSRFDLDLAAAWKVGYLGYGIELSPEAIKKIDEGRRVFEQILDSDRSRYIYGTTTGPGSRAHRILNPESQDTQGQRLIDYLPFNLGILLHQFCQLHQFQSHPLWLNPPHHGHAVFPISMKPMVSRLHPGEKQESEELSVGKFGGGCVQ